MVVVLVSVLASAVWHILTAAVVSGCLQARVAAAAVCHVLLAQCCAGAPQIRAHWLECALRVQCQRPQCMHTVLAGTHGMAG